MVLALEAGDTVTVCDSEGLQSAALFASPADAVDLTADAKILTDARLEDAAEGALNGAALLRAVLDLGGEPEAFRGVILLPEDGPPGALARFRAKADLICILLAPGQATTPVGQSAPTDLDIFIDTQSPSRGWGGAPLAKPKVEFIIEAASAQTYTVAAGDYIQVVDIEGRQCSDFLAFDAKALSEGRERGLEPTVTRTLMGLSSPRPGLHGKFFDGDMQPLVEIVQDTVGRHDTFLMACAAKYYDDAGYPGHANCTDNFNRALEPFGVEARKGWPAINFFYNTSVTDAGAMVYDEPWSRPGDYVLLRALTDLVCASSSCADDIDPANGWNPTDILVRTYDRTCQFPPGLATRMTPDAEPRLTRKTAFHDRTSARTRNFIDYKGFWTPTCFSNAGPIEEYWACREKAVAIDLSALRKFEIIGPDAEQLMQLALTRDIRKLAVDQVVYSAMCYDHGGMIDDGTLFRLGRDNFRWVCGDDYCGVWLRSLAAQYGLKAFVKSSTDQLHNLAVQGPLSREILKYLVVTPAHKVSLEDLKWFRFTVGKIGDASVVVSRTGYTGELGYEIWCHPKDGLAIWDAVFAVGEPLGLLPLGLDALDMVRIEAGLVFAGYEFSDQTDPFEAGVGFAVPVAKVAPFVGSEALARRRQSPQRQLVGLDCDTSEAVGHGDPIYVGRAQVGVVTSALRSPVLGRTIALARVDVAHSDLGAAVEIGKLDGLQKRFAAAVVRFPHYDPDKARVRQ